MEHDEALDALGLTASSTAAEARAAFRRLIVEFHPDRAGASGAERTREVVAAYRLVTAGGFAIADPLEQPADPGPGDYWHESAADDQGATEANVWLVASDTIALACTREEAYARLLAAGQALGSITYFDRDGDILEVLLRTVLGDTLSMVVSLQGRSSWVEAFVTTEVLDVARHELPSTGQIVELMEHELRRRW